MKALADTLNQEVAVYNGSRAGSGPSPDADIAVHIAFPCGIISPGLENENKLKPAITVLLEKDDKPQAPEDVAKATLNGLSAGQFCITTMPLGHLLRGCGMGGSLRSSPMDLFWNFAGSIVILFVAPDFISKCRNWGKQRGMHATKAAT
jgi:3-dehydrosphinganine reductase